MWLVGIAAFAYFVVLLIVVACAPRPMGINWRVAPQRGQDKAPFGSFASPSTLQPVSPLEPIQKVVESEESDVIPSLAPERLWKGCQCGSLNIAALPIAAACVIRAI
jgi:hypothetical protein